MAATAPDVSGLTLSAQVFAAGHTLPQIRAIHKALHAQIDDKATRLRTQVGGSYRELLGTADGIVRMAGDVAQVQATLGRMGAHCGRAVVLGKVNSLARFVRERDDGVDGVTAAATAAAGHSGGLGPIARARLLEACALAVGKVLRTGVGSVTAATTATASASVSGLRDSQQGGGGQIREGPGDRLVVAAKVLVLSRLLVKTLSEETLPAEASAAVESSKKALGGLRRRLLRRIEKVLERVGGSVDRKDVLRALCAYGLATSSGARDVLSHFLEVRGDAMTLAFEADQDGDHERRSKDVLHSLGLYTKTLLDVQALVPNRLTEALAGLKKNDLLADESLRQLEGLRLDVYQRWCGDEIQYFKPYIRHDDLEGKQAKEMLTSWANKGGEVLLQGLEKILGRLTELKTIVDMRTEVLQLWIKDGGKAKGFDPSIMLDKLRRAINTHMLRVLDAKVGKLRLVGSEVSATLDAWQEGVTDRQQSLWGPDGFDMALSTGAAHFAQDVISALYGRNDAVARAVSSYMSWHHVIDDVGEVVGQLRRQRWDNDVDDIEEEETIEQRQQLLSKEDPQMLDQHLAASLERAFGQLGAQLGKLWDEERSQGPNRGQIAMYLVRVLRDIRSRLPKLATIGGFGLGMVPALHEAIATATAVSPLDEFATTALARRIVTGRSLWEGRLELPAAPSPGTFRLLRAMSVAMGDAGLDLWTPAAVGALKRHVSRQLAAVWAEALGNLDSQVDVGSGGSVNSADETSDGDQGGGEVEEGDPGREEGNEAVKAETPAPASQAAPSPPHRDLLLQWFFDISMLRICLETGPDDGGPLMALGERVYQQSGELRGGAGGGEGGEDAGAARDRMVGGARDYWKRTSLLFELLT